MKPVFIFSGARTPIGAFGGSLSGFAPADLGGLVITESLRRARIAPGQVGPVVVGNVIPTVPKDAYLARVAAIRASIPVEALALTLNRLCGSGLGPQSRLDEWLRWVMSDSQSPEVRR